MARYQYPLEVYGIQTLLDEGVQVEDLELKDLMVMILSELKVLNAHMAIMTDEEISTTRINEE